MVTATAEIVCSRGDNKGQEVYFPEILKLTNRKSVVFSVCLVTK